MENVGEDCCREVKCCEGVLWRSVVGKCRGEVLERSVVEKCWRRVL